MTQIARPVNTPQSIAYRANPTFYYPITAVNNHPTVTQSTFTMLKRRSVKSVFGLVRHVLQNTNVKHAQGCSISTKHSTSAEFTNSKITNVHYRVRYLIHHFASMTVQMVRKNPKTNKVETNAFAMTRVCNAN